MADVYVVILWVLRDFCHIGFGVAVPDAGDPGRNLFCTVCNEQYIWPIITYNFNLGYFTIVYDNILNSTNHIYIHGGRAEGDSGIRIE